MRPGAGNLFAGRRPPLRRGWAPLAILLLVAQARPLWACAACYGASDGPMARGMNWGIMSLLVFIGCVLLGVAGFFVFLVRRAGRMSSGAAPAPAAARPAARRTASASPFQPPSPALESGAGIN